MATSEDRSNNKPTPISPHQGLSIDFSNNDAARRQAIEAAFDYRGDVTLRLTESRIVEGYLFDRRHGGAGAGEGEGGGGVGEACIRLIVKASGDRMTIRMSEIESIQFTGRDAAAGKSWERWVQHYTERKRAGLEAGLFPDEWMDDRDSDTS